MKKRLLSLLFAASCCMMVTACQPESTTEEVDSLSEASGFLKPSQAVTNTMVNTWNVVDCEDVYVFAGDGTGTFNDEEITFECGFNSDNDITMCIESEDGEEVYKMSTDDTGYGVELEAMKGGKDKILLPANIEFLSLDDERIEGIAGEWADKSDNRYILDEKMGLLIKGSSGDSKGTYSVVVKDDKLVLCLVVNGSGLEFEFEMNEDATEMCLNNLDAEAVHEWVKK